MTLTTPRLKHWQVLAAAFAVFALGPATLAYAQSTVARDVLEINRALNEMCRGWSGDDSHTDEVCDVRLKVEKLLGKLGYCYGTVDDFGPNGGGHASSNWHKCSAKSVYRP